MLALAMGAIGAAALVAAIALGAITGYMHQAVVAMMAATESVHTAEEMEVDLLVHSRLGDRMGRAQLEGQLRGWLLEIRQHVNSPEEDELVDVVAARIDAYLKASSQAQLAGLSTEEIAAQVAPELEAAFLPLEELVHLNVRQSQVTAKRAASWDRLATYFGVGVTAVLVLTAGWVLLWLRLFAFRSVMELETAMRRFAEGDKSARATVMGARELRGISVRFNEMASALARQHDNQIAFLGGVVHDLRNPLSVLKLAAAALNLDRPPQNAEALQKTLGTVKRQVERLERMLEDLLDAAQIEGGHLELRVARSDLIDLCREVVETFRESAPQREIRLNAPDASVNVVCDPLRIGQVLTNLVSNAIKYSPVDGMIKVTLERAEREVMLCVTDQGIGIPEEDRERIFEPFRRVGASRGLVPGAGMGLFVARRIVEAHGGRIEVISQRGAGTTFRVVLPEGPSTRG
jgi:signal transduction histidine kinase